MVATKMHCPHLFLWLQISNCYPWGSTTTFTESLLFLECSQPMTAQASSCRTQGFTGWLYKRTLHPTAPNCLTTVPQSKTFLVVASSFHLFFHRCRIYIMVWKLSLPLLLLPLVLHRYFPPLISCMCNFITASSSQSISTNPKKAGLLCLL